MKTRDTKGDKTTSAADIVLALFLVKCVYTGFDQPFYALAEVRRLRRVFASSVVAAMLYLLIILPLINIGYMCAIPYENSVSLGCHACENCHHQDHLQGADSEYDQHCQLPAPG